MDRENLLWTALFLGLAIFTWWLNGQDQAKQPAQAAQEGHFPDHYGENLVATEMDESGFPARNLTAQRMTHYADDGSSEFVRPRLMVFEGEKPPWVVRSSSGWMSGSGVDLLLQGEVQIDREAGEGVRPVHFTTRDLRVNTETEFAQTDQPVFAISLSDKVESVGMQAWLKAPMRVQLLSKVRGRYAVEK